MLFVQSKDVLWRNVNGGALLTSEQHEDVEDLSPTAAAVWRLLEGPRTPAEIVEQLSARYDAPPEVIDGDIEAVLEQLLDFGFVETVSDVDD